MTLKINSKAPTFVIPSTSNDKYSLLQKTIKRISNLKKISSPILVCNEEHRFVTAEQIREIGIKPKSILLEPCSRNTAPAIILATLKSIVYGNDPILLILPADHQIKNNKEFINSIPGCSSYTVPFLFFWAFREKTNKKLNK